MSNLLTFGNFRFAHPWLLGLLLLLPLFLYLARGASGTFRPATLRYADVGLVKREGTTWRIVLMWVPTMLRWLAFVFLIVALARPQLGESRQIIRGEGVDIALALDISGSMASLDFEPNNRLEAAQNVISDFIDARQFDRVGLIVFAQSAFAQSPLTVDHNVLNRLLNQVELAPDLGLEDGTAIGMGIATAANMLKESDADSRVIVLLTDGVNNAGQIDPFTAAQAAKALGIRVYTIGVGKSGQVPVPSTNIFGNEVIVYQESNIDEATLQTIADETGGLFRRAEDTQELGQIYDEISELEKSEVEIQTFSRFDELAQYALFPALALLAAELFLRQTAFRKLP